jgi:hypothetical protein
MSTPIAVFIEHTPKRTFATAVDWPGWSRAGRSEALAVEALVAYAPRYAKIAEAERLEFRANSDLANVEVVERREGSAGTEYGVPSHPSSLDARPMDVDEAHRRAGLVEAAWRFFDATSVSAPEELRKGPRGGGRDTSKIVAHVLEAERAYAAQMGIKIAEFASDDRAAIDAMRGSMLDVLRAAREGTPLAGRRWPPRYAGHRIAWHALDHAWEIEDRTE